MHLVLVGDGPELAKLQSKAAQLGVTEAVHFVGRRKDVGDWLAAMDVYVNCSISEGMSQSILEAMAAGLPVAATEVGANAQLVAESSVISAPCGLIAAAGDPAALADAVCSVAADPETRAAYSAAARRRHQELYAVDVMVANYEALYGRLVNAGDAAG